jgi:hypothetical protein
MTWITAPTTAPEDWRKWRERVARQSLVEAFPDGPPLGLTLPRMVERAHRVCDARGWPKPGERTYQRAINGT